MSMRFPFARKRECVLCCFRINAPPFGTRAGRDFTASRIPILAWFWFKVHVGDRVTRDPVGRAHVGREISRTHP